LEVREAEDEELRGVAAVVVAAVEVADFFDFLFFEFRTESSSKDQASKSASIVIDGSVESPRREGAAAVINHRLSSHAHSCIRGTVNGVSRVLAAGGMSERVVAVAETVTRRPDVACTVTGAQSRFFASNWTGGLPPFQGKGG